MRLNLKFSVCCCLLLLSGVIFGAYINNHPVPVSQPDGSKLELFASGDEFYNWLHDKDGYTIKQNAQGWYVFMAKAASGELIFTDLIAGKDLPSSLGLQPWTNISGEKQKDIRSTANRQLKEIGNGRAPTTGTLNNISIFIRFSDQTEFGQNLSVYSSLFNGTTGNTLQNYFSEASYGTLNINTNFYPTPTTMVVSWQDSHPRAYYSPYSASNTIGYNGDTERTDREFTLLVNAVTEVRSQIPTSLILDGDNDGMVDNVCFIIKGNSDGWSELLWPHRWSIYDRVVNINGKRVYDFNFQLSEFIASRGVGVLCHEMFHSLGSPDLYHYTDNGIAPVGSWDIMESDGNPPQHMGAFMKYKYGHWISSIPALTADGTYYLNPLTSSTNNCYKIASPNSSTEYFVVEYRKKTGTFENSLPGSGLLVYRINTSAGDGNADGPPDEVYVYRPGGTTTVNGTVNSANYSLESGRTAINSTTNPSPFLTNGTAGGLNISQIGSAGNTISFVLHIPLSAPRNLTLSAGNQFVTLNWQAPSYGSPTGYRIYKNNALLTTVSGTTYTDNAVENGNVYSYYLVASYPSGLSAPTGTVAAIPFVNPPLSVNIGTGTASNGTTDASPVNIYYKSLHGQSIYTKAELNALGLIGPAHITRIGFNVVQAPIYSLPNFIVRMKHSTAANVANWQTSNGMQLVYTADTYVPVAGSYNMLTLSSPFLWNGTDNLVIDTAFSLLTNWDRSGTTQYTSVSNGYRFTRDDYSDQSSVFTGGSVSAYRPNLRLTSIPLPVGPNIALNQNSLSYGAIVLGNSHTLPFTIQNTGDQTLSGTLVTPAGYTVSAAGRVLTRTQDNVFSSKEEAPPEQPEELRNSLSFSLAGGISKTYNLVFNPGAVGNYPGNVVISSNAGNNPTLNLQVSGSAYIPPTISIDHSSLEATLTTNASGPHSFSIGNSGSQLLSYTITENPDLPWFSLSPASGNVAGSGTQLINGTFNSSGLAPGLHTGVLQVASNDPAHPQLTINLNLTVTNSLPAISLPAAFTFDRNSSLNLNFSSWVSDPDPQTLILGYSGNTNVIVSVNGLSVTLSAVPDWFGTEEISFSVFDGYAYAYDTVTVRVNLDFLAQPVLTGVLPSTNGFTISWQAVPNAATYKIYRAFSPDGSFELIGSSSGLAFEDTGAFTRAFYQVVAVYLQP